MNKKTNYYALLKYTLLAFIWNLLLGQANQVLLRFRDVQVDVFDIIISLISVVKVLLVIIVILGCLITVYFIFNYYSSQFYQDYRIGITEAFYNGFIDIYQVYDKVKASSTVTEYKVDFKRQIIYFSTKKQHYSVIFQDLFGRIQGKINSEFWGVLSKPKKEYGKKQYTKIDKFPNPYRTNQEFIEQLKLKTGKTYQNYIAIAGFYKIDEKSKQIIAPYEMIDLLNA
jgi:hypothetical protein